MESPSLQDQPAHSLQMEKSLTSLHGDNVSTAVGSSRGFTYFPLLPPELRQEIWKAALEPRAYLMTMHGGPRLPSIYRSPYPHVLRGVCKESRYIAHTQTLRQRTIPWHHDPSYTACDILVLRAYENLDSSDLSDPSVAAAMEYARGVKHIAFLDDARDYSGNLLSKFFSGAFCRPHRPTFSLIRTAIDIIAPYHLVQASGLFGYRERMALIDVGDSAKLARYRQFYETYSKLRDFKMSQLLEMLSRPEGVEAYVMAAWSTLYEAAEAPRVDRIQDNTPRNYWNRRSYNRLGVECDSKNAWARKRLAKLPDFEHVIMFRIAQYVI